MDIAARERLQRPAKLREIKSQKEFADWELVRMSRLSVMPVGEKMRRAILAMAKEL